MMMCHFGDSQACTRLENEYGDVVILAQIGTDAQTQEHWNDPHWLMMMCHFGDSQACDRLENEYGDEDTLAQIETETQTQRFENWMRMQCEQIKLKLIMQN